MGVEDNFTPFITIRVMYTTANKNPKALIYKASGTSGWRDLNSRPLEPHSRMQALFINGSSVY